MASTLVVIHERLGNWARQVRPRLGATAAGLGPIRWAETRSGADLERVVRGRAVPLVLLDVGARPRAMLEDLDRAVQAASDGLFLVLDPADRPAVATLARELGATLVVSGFVPPPAVADLLGRWVALSRSRAEADGWADRGEPEPELWERRDLLGPAPAPARSRGPARSALQNEPEPANDRDEEPARCSARRPRP